MVSRGSLVLFSGQPPREAARVYSADATNQKRNSAVGPGGCCLGWELALPGGRAGPFLQPMFLCSPAGDSRGPAPSGCPSAQDRPTPELPLGAGGMPMADGCRRALRGAIRAAAASGRGTAHLPRPARGLLSRASPSTTSHSAGWEGSWRDGSPGRATQGLHHLFWQVFQCRRSALPYQPTWELQVFPPSQRLPQN